VSELGSEYEGSLINGSIIYRDVLLCNSRGTPSENLYWFGYGSLSHGRCPMKFYYIVLCSYSHDS